VTGRGGRPLSEASLPIVAILVDPAAWPSRDRLWCHLVSDVSYDELHEFARRCGIPERAFERDHYDLPAERRGDV